MSEINKNLVSNFVYLKEVFQLMIKFLQTKRQQIWLNTEYEIRKHNSRQMAGLETYQMVHNEFSDMTTAEIQAYLGARRDETIGNGRGHMALHIKQLATTTAKPTTDSALASVLAVTKFEAN